MDYSDNLWRFDKIDLFFLVFVLFIALSLVTFATEIELVDTTFVPGVVYYGGNVFTSLNSTYPRGGTAYFKLEKGYIYTLKFTGNIDTNASVGVCNSIPEVGALCSFVGSLNLSNRIVTYKALDDNYLFLCYSWAIQDVEITREKANTMPDVVTFLSNDVGPNQFWNIFSLAIPFVLVAVLVVFGFFIIRRLTKKEIKGDIRF